jgi:ABC-type uncharacterized transport system YnjBCD permease subunit
MVARMRAAQGARERASPLPAVPQAATAFGLAFLLMPSGWIARAHSVVVIKRVFRGGDGNLRRRFGGSC